MVLCRIKNAERNKTLFWFIFYLEHAIICFMYQIFCEKKLKYLHDGKKRIAQNWNIVI